MNASPLLQVKELSVEVGGHDVLKSISLDIPAGELHVLMGANGSGKSTLGLTLAGHPQYHVTGGSATLGGEDLLALPPEKRAQAGLFLSFQAPPEIPGVRNAVFVRTALNAVREASATAGNGLIILTVGGKMSAYVDPDLPLGDYRQLTEEELESLEEYM